MNTKSYYQIDLKYGDCSYWTPVYNTTDPNKLFSMYKHLQEDDTDKNKIFRCSVLLGGYYRPITF